jgi:two-component system cell cycle response regulator CpdR
MARILLTEDDEAVRGFVRRALEFDGHAVDTAENGAEGLERLEAETFDLLLTDIKMPLMDGIALALAAAARFPRLPVMLMTGYADQRERTHGLDAIIRDVVMKPFTLAEIRARVAATLRADGG